MIYIYSENVNEGVIAKNIISDLGIDDVSAYSDKKKILDIIGKIAESSDYILLLTDPKKRLLGKGIIKKREEGETAAEFVRRICEEEGWTEEEITEEKLENIKQLADHIINRQSIKDEQSVKAVIDNVITSNYHFSSDDRADIVDLIYNKLRGYGIIEPLLEDDSISEIMVNGLDKIWIEKEGKLSRTDLAFSSEDELMSLVRRLALDGGKQIDMANPMQDVEITTRNGSSVRVNLVLDCVSPSGNLITIRKKTVSRLELDELVPDQKVRDFLLAVVRGRLNVSISGGTGSGKTTLLNALVKRIPDNERVIIVEDTPEIQADRENMVSIVTRQANTEQHGEISCAMVIKNTLRMRPDRVIVGEVRGREILDMLNAMNTGHDGSFTTGHANSSRDMMLRLESLALTDGSLPPRAIKMMIASALDINVHVSRLRDGSRRITEISEIRRMDKNEDIEVVPLFIFQEDADESTQDKVCGRLVRTTSKMENLTKFISSGMTREAAEKLINYKEESEYDGYKGFEKGRIITIAK